MLRNSGQIPTLLTFLILGTIAISGLGIQLWMTPIPAEDMTPARENLLTTADWMVKASVGAFLGFAGGARLAGRNGHHSSETA